MIICTLCGNEIIESQENYICGECDDGGIIYSHSICVDNIDNNELILESSRIISQQYITYN